MTKPKIQRTFRTSKRGQIKSLLKFRFPPAGDSPKLAGARVNGRGGPATQTTGYIVTSACKYPASLSVVDEMSKFTPVLTLLFTLKPRASPAPVIHQLKNCRPSLSLSLSLATVVRSSHNFLVEESGKTSRYRNSCITQLIR